TTEPHFDLGLGQLHQLISLVYVNSSFRDHSQDGAGEGGAACCFGASSKALPERL
ncbi:hypothetical protein PGIGA_G00018960, partial [Pangasianodon gigas]|nr:hypothetical protein [Pangasianodon gigas]